MHKVAKVFSVLAFGSCMVSGSYLMAALWAVMAGVQAVTEKVMADRKPVIDVFINDVTVLNGMIRWAEKEGKSKEEIDLLRAKLERLQKDEVK